MGPPIYGNYHLALPNRTAVFKAPLSGFHVSLPGGYAGCTGMRGGCEALGLRKSCREGGFPNLGVPCWGCYNSEGDSVLGTILGSPYLGKLQGTCKRTFFEFSYSLQPLKDRLAKLAWKPRYCSHVLMKFEPLKGPLGLPMLVSGRVAPKGGKTAPN